jgi:hypothetical protein
VEEVVQLKLSGGPGARKNHGKSPTRNTIYGKNIWEFYGKYLWTNSIWDFFG